MAKNITASGAATVATAVDGIEIKVNLGYIGSLVVSAAGSTQYNTPAATLGTITNPVTGQTYTYRNLRTQGAISINPSTTTDLTVNFLGPGSF